VLIVRDDEHDVGDDEVAPPDVSDMGTGAGRLDTTGRLAAGGPGLPKCWVLQDIAGDGKNQEPPVDRQANLGNIRLSFYSGML